MRRSGARDWAHSSISGKHYAAPRACPREALDAFAYQGGFALRPGHAPAPKSRASTRVPPRARLADRNASLNGVTFEWIEANASISFALADAGPPLRTVVLARRHSPGVRQSGDRPSGLQRAQPCERSRCCARRILVSCCCFLSRQPCPVLDGCEFRPRMSTEIFAS